MGPKGIAARDDRTTPLVQIDRRLVESVASFGREVPVSVSDRRWPMLRVGSSTSNVRRFTATVRMHPHSGGGDEEGDVDERATGITALHPAGPPAVMLRTRLQGRCGKLRVRLRPGYHVRGHGSNPPGCGDSPVPTPPRDAPPARDAGRAGDALQCELRGAGDRGSAGVVCKAAGISAIDAFSQRATRPSRSSSARASRSPRSARRMSRSRARCQPEGSRWAPAGVGQQELGGEGWWHRPPPGRCGQL